MYLSVFILFAIIGYKIYLKIKGDRPKVYKKFDRIWFWGYLTTGVIGLFVWFSRTQNLPIFSTRFISYSFLLIFILFTAYLIYLFTEKTPKELNKYYEKKRKEKYLK